MTSSTSVLRGREPDSAGGESTLGNRAANISEPPTTTLVEECELWAPGEDVRGGPCEDVSLPDAVELECVTTA
jgi:hypothetical protein